MVRLFRTWLKIKIKMFYFCFLFFVFGARYCLEYKCSNAQYIKSFDTHQSVLLNLHYHNWHVAGPILSLLSPHHRFIATAVSVFAFLQPFWSWLHSTLSQSQWVRFVFSRNYSHWHHPFTAFNLFDEMPQPTSNLDHFIAMQKKW